MTTICASHFHFGAYCVVVYSLAQRRKTRGARRDVMRAEFKPAIDALQSDLAELEAKVAETKRAINRLCELAGVDALYADISEANQKRSASTISALRSDQFYGRVMTT